ncbi:MAG TPA: thioredoxin [Candidatus Thermoplasmatota archaeon]|nr:thioredoxin [Candidatus Thermoplasmatota archaeon]
MANAPTTPVDVTDAEFAQFVKQYPNVVVDAWAPWCGPCKRIAPIMDELAKEYGGKVAIAKLNTDDNQRTAMQFGIMSIPTLLVFKDGQRVDQIVGLMPKDALQQRFNRAFGL